MEISCRIYKPRRPCESPLYRLARSGDLVAVPHEKIPQLGEENRQLMRKSRGFAYP